MKKILVITAIVTFFVATLTLIKLQEYNKSNKVAEKRNEIEEIDKKIETKNKEIEDINKQLDEVSGSNKEKIELLELWQKQLKKLQNNI